MLRYKNTNYNLGKLTEFYRRECIEDMQDCAEKFSDLEDVVIRGLKRKAHDYRDIRVYDNFLHDENRKLRTEISFLENVWQNTKQMYYLNDIKPHGFAEFIKPSKEEMRYWINQKYDIDN